MKNIILSVINSDTKNELKLHFSSMSKCCNTIDILAKELRLTSELICRTKNGCTEAYYISPFGKFKMTITAIEIDGTLTVSDLNFLVQNKHNYEEIDNFIKELTKRQTKKSMIIRLTGNNLGSGYIVRKMTESDILEALKNGFTVEKIG